MVWLFFATLLLAVFGFGISLYGFMVEQKIKSNQDYKPVCDISDKISCSKPFKSPYGKLLGVSNTVVGMVFYATIFVLALFGQGQALQFLSLCALIATGVFAYLLYVKIKSFCLICNATYVVNILLFLLWFI